MLGKIALASAASIAAVWGIYPLGVAALASIRRRPPRAAGSEPPQVSVVLATREDPAAIAARVDDVFRSAYDPARLEMIVAVDAGSGAPLPESLATADGRVRVVRGDAPGGKAATLNAGVRAASGEVLVFTDTHQRFEADAIPHLVGAVSRDGFGAASGRLELRSVPGARSLVEHYWSYERWLRRSEARVHSTVGVTGAVYALRRSLWAPLPAGLILDDVYVPMRVVLDGHRVAFVDAARARETRQTTSGQEYTRKVRTLTGVIQLCAWLPAVLVPLRNPIWTQFVFHKLLRLLTPYWVLGIGVWVAVKGGGLLLRVPPGVTLTAGALVVGAAALKPALPRRVRGVLVQGTLLQAAVVTATVNGLRGRWDVWKK